MADNASKADVKQHEYVKYKLEQEIKKYAPLVPEIQTLLIPPKGKYCNADYTFCPHLLYGGFCKELNVYLQPVDGAEFTSILSFEFWKHEDDKYRPIEPGSHDVAVGCYKVFKKKCGVKK